MAAGRRAERRSKVKRMKERRRRVIFDKDHGKEERHNERRKRLKHGGK